jgi:hypothetical protein
VNCRFIPRVWKVGLFRGDNIYDAPKEIFGFDQKRAKVLDLRGAHLFARHPWRCQAFSAPTNARRLRQQRTLRVLFPCRRRRLQRRLSPCPGALARPVDRNCPNRFSSSEKPDLDGVSMGVCDFLRIIGNL